MNMINKLYNYTILVLACIFVLDVPFIALWSLHNLNLLITIDFTFKSYLSIWFLILIFSLFSNNNREMKIKISEDVPPKPLDKNIFQSVIENCLYSMYMEKKYMDKKDEIENKTKQNS